MQAQLTRPGAVLAVIASWGMFSLSPSAQASTAYGTLNNFDCVNDTGVEAHGFEIELEDIHSTDITYTYDYNHYGIPKITEDNSDPAHPRVTVRYAAKKMPDGTWSAFTAIPSGPISPTDGHQFTNPSVNFGGEHFGVGYYGAPTAVRYFWLIDDGSGNLVHGPPVYVSTPTFNYYPPMGQQPAQVQAVVVPPPPPAPPPLQFGEATWVKDIKTTTHNPGKVELTDLVDPDPDNPDAHNWANGEPAEVETEWRILQTEFANADNPKGILEGVPEDLPDGDEVITRRYEFYKYIGPIDAESGEGMADEVGPDGIHGVGSVTYNDHFDPITGEWVEVTVDLSTVEVVGEFFGAQMAGFDVAPVLGLIDHIPDGELGVAYADRTVVIAGGAAFLAAATGSLPDGTMFDPLTGVFSGTPTAAGVFTFTVEASDTTGAAVSREYIVTIPESVPETSTIVTSASPMDGGTTVGDGTYDNGTPVTVVATHNEGYAFVNWTEGGMEVSVSAAYPFTVAGDRILVANFVPVGCTIDSECADADACTADSCVDGQCDHQPIAGCCNTGAECADGNICTVDSCIDHACWHEVTPGCCLTDADCADDDPCTGDACVGNVCEYVPIPGCCTTDAQCADADECTMDFCDPTTMLCVNRPVDGCCTEDAECEDQNACTMDRCLDNVCQHMVTPDCCHTDVECDDGIECTVDSCSLGVCRHTADDGRCDDTVGCTRDVCVPQHGCVNTPDNALCDDGLFCNGVEWCHPIADCRPARGKPCPPPFCDEVNNRCTKWGKLKSWTNQNND